MDSSSSTFLTTTTTSLNQSSRNSPKQKKKKSSSSSSSPTNKSIKVRYISNPMKVKTCASKFRELVQELTGQDAVDIQEPEEPVISPSDRSLSPPPCTAENLAPSVLLHQEPLDERVVDYYEPLDGEEMFLPDQMSAGFSGFFSNGFYNVNDFGRIDSM